jgi:peroxiredoxin
MNITILIPSLLIAGSLLAGAADSKPLSVGTVIPDAALRTAQGDEFKLRDAVKQKPAVLIFYRGGWCPYCTLHLSALAGVEKELIASGFQLLAVSTDQPSKLREKPEHQALKYTLLSDSTMEAAKAFGIAFKVPDELVAKYKNSYGIDLEAASGQKHHLLPHPAVFIVDTAGVIRFAHVNEDYKVRLEPEKILAAARAVSRTPSE